MDHDIGSFERSEDTAVPNTPGIVLRQAHTVVKERISLSEQTVF